MMQYGLINFVRSFNIWFGSKLNRPQLREDIFLAITNKFQKSFVALLDYELDILKDISDPVSKSTDSDIKLSG